MRIISQDSSLSIDFDEQPITVFEEYIKVDVDKQVKVLGKYESSNRAKEIFDEMHEEYVKEMTDEPFRVVYKMPEV